MDFSDVSLAPGTRLRADEFVMLWVDDWYDGPLSAMLQRGDEYLYLEVHDRKVVPTDDPWRWVVLRLTPRALAERLHQHALFAHHVGDRWCCHDAPHPTIDGEPRLEEFYRQQAARPALTRADCEVIGWLADKPEPQTRRARR